VTLSSGSDKRDIEELAAEVFSAEKGYDVALDLAGADTYAVAYGTVAVTEKSSVCVATDEKGNCLKWETTEQSTRAEVGWDAIGSVWEADTTLAHEGFLELKVHARDTRGRKLETAKSKLGVPWRDDGEGVSALATDEDPLTRLAFHNGRYKFHKARRAYHGLSVVSEGWTDLDDLPTEVTVELTNGKTISIPVNAYLRYGRTDPSHVGEAMYWLPDDVAAGVLAAQAIGELRVQIAEDSTGNIVAFDVLPDTDLGEPMCSDGYCVVLSQDEAGAYVPSVTAYDELAPDLPDAVGLTFLVGDEPLGEELGFTFEDEITAVFTTEVLYAADPTDLGLAGKVSLLGAPNRNGEQDTLAKGKFYAEISRDYDGDIELAGGDKDAVVSSGQVVVAGEPIGLVDGAGDPDAPPVVLYGVQGNGSGTRNASSQASIKPQLL
jgi:hypothetical protein